MTQLHLEAHADFCNKWPTLMITHNGKIIHNGTLEDKIILDYTLQDRQSWEQSDMLRDCDVASANEIRNNLLVGMKGKRFGANNVWDTVMDGGKMVEDLEIHLDKVTLDDVDILDLLLDDNYYVEFTEGMQDYHKTNFKGNGELAFNGYYQMNYQIPLYESLTNQKWKKPLETDRGYFSNDTQVFHYDDEMQEIREIEEILKEIDEKFSDIRSKTRNT